VYKNQIKDLEAEISNINYEPVPSGEINESLIPVHLLQAKIDTLDLVIVDLKNTLK
jgi:hypothetical protein